MRSQDQDQVMENAEEEKVEEESEQYHSIPEEPIIELPEHHSESHSEVDAEHQS